MDTRSMHWRLISLFLKIVSSFIEKYGTHIIVGLGLGGQDVVYVKQDNSSPLSPSETKEHLDRLGDQLFTGTCTLPPSNRKIRDHKYKVSKIMHQCMFILCRHIMKMNWNVLTVPTIGPRGLQCIWCPSDTEKASRNDYSSFLQRGI